MKNIILINEIKKNNKKTQNSSLIAKPTSIRDET
jgi:hypothetical protein